MYNKLALALALWPAGKILRHMYWRHSPTKMCMIKLYSHCEWRWNYKVIKLQRLPLALFVLFHWHLPVCTEIRLWYDSQPCNCSMQVRDRETPGNQGWCCALWCVPGASSSLQRDWTYEMLAFSYWVGLQIIQHGQKRQQFLAFLTKPASFLHQYLLLAVPPTKCVALNGGQILAPCKDTLH